MAQIREQRRHERTPQNFNFEFLVLYMQTSDLRREKAAGTVLDASPSGIGIKTEFPLQPGHILEWDDAHKKDNLHLALVKWARQEETYFRAGLKFL